MGLEVGAQRNHKRQRVERALAGLCAAEASVKFESPGPELGYRRRTRLAFRRVGTGLVLGFHEHGSRQLVNVERCVVLTPPLSAALEQVRAQLGPLLEGAGEIELEDARGERVAVAVRCERAQAPEVYRAAEQLAKIAPIALVELAVEDLPPARFGEREPPRGSDGLPLQAPAHGFLQVNAQVNARLGDLVRELAQPEGARVLELYAGHGNFTVALAADAANLVAVEGDRRAADACRENLRVRGHTRARVLTSDVRELSLREAFDVIVLDPPRAGAPALAGLVAQTLPARVVYISCHLTTLVRDLRTLHAAGYTADRVHALDMFPQTGHVEAVVRMHRALS
jgi:23S rRNA (uracil1939-C5)-methyltransferase